MTGYSQGWNPLTGFVSCSWFCLEPPEFIGQFFNDPARRLARWRPLGYRPNVPPEHGIGYEGELNPEA